MKSKCSMKLPTKAFYYYLGGAERTLAYARGAFGEFR